jgi:hypothetical protein
MNNAASAHGDFRATFARSIRGVDQTIGTMMQNSIDSDAPFPFLRLPLEIQMRIAQIYIGSPRMKVHLGGRYPPRLTYTRMVDLGTGRQHHAPNGYQGRSEQEMCSEMERQ